MNASRSRTGWLQPLLIGLVACVPLRPVPAQDYSANVVGYIDVALVAGSNLVIHPLKQADVAISNVFPALPSGSYFFPWNQELQRFESTNHFHPESGWADPAWPLGFAQGGFLSVPSAVRVSFVGEPTGLASCINFPAGTDAFVMFPLAACGFCGEFTDPCPFFPEDGTMVRKWDAANQTWLDLAQYVEGVGWFPEEPKTAAGEGAFLRSPGPTGARMGLGWGSEPSLPPVSLLDPRYDGTGFHLQIEAVPMMKYRLQRNHRLGTNGWRTVLTTNVMESGRLTLSDFGVTNAMSFYRLAPGLLLVNPVRSGNTFQFQFEAEEGIAYIVSRTTVLELDSVWSPVTTIPSGNGGVMLVTDVYATNATAFYRLERSAE